MPESSYTESRQLSLPCCVLPHAMTDYKTVGVMLFAVPEKGTYTTVSLHGWIIQSFKFLSYSRKIPLVILITVQRDATKSSLFIILQVHSTCFSHVGGR